jgi:hypothetical protein
MLSILRMIFWGNSSAGVPRFAESNSYGLFAVRDFLPAP